MRAEKREPGLLRVWNWGRHRSSTRGQQRPSSPESTAEHKGSLCDCYYTSWHNTKKNEANRMKFLWCSRTEGQTSAGCRKGDKGRTEEKITLKTEWRREKQKKQRRRKEGQKNVRPLFKLHSEMALRYLQCLIRSSVLLTLDLTSLAANPQGHINSFNTESPQCAAAQSCKQAPEPKPGPYQTTFIQTRDKKGSETSTALRTNEASDLWNQTCKLELLTALLQQVSDRDGTELDMLVTVGPGSFFPDVDSVIWSRWDSNNREINQWIVSLKTEPQKKAFSFSAPCLFYAQNTSTRSHSGRVPVRWSSRLNWLLSI